MTYEPYTSGMEMTSSPSHHESLLNTSGKKLRLMDDINNGSTLLSNSKRTTSVKNGQRD